MTQTIMLLPKKQLVTDFIQLGEDALDIGYAWQAAFQCFVGGWGAGGGSVIFTPQTSTSRSDDEFVDWSESVTLSEASGDTSEFVPVIPSRGAFVRFKVEITLGSNTSIEVRVQGNLNLLSR